MKNRIFSLLKFLIGWPFSIVAIFFLFKLVAPQAPQFLSKLNEISPLLLTCGFLCFLFYYFFRGYIWKRLVKQAGYELSYKDTNFIWATSEIKRYIPGNIWSFVGRTVLLNDKGMTKKDIAKCTLYEIEFLILGSATVSLLSLPFLNEYFNFSSLTVNFILIGYLIITFLFIFQKNLNIKFVFLPYYKATEMLFLLFLYSLLFLFFGLGYFFIFSSYVSIDPNLIWQLTGVSILSFLIGYLSLLTPSGIGVREGALVVSLSKIMATSVAGFIALFARFVLIIAEIVYVALSYLWNQTKNVKVAKIERLIGNHPQITVLLALCLVYILYFSTVSFLRYQNLYTGKFDLGNMAQTVWNTTQGRFFEFTNPDIPDNVSRLSVHADFILILLAPLYAIWPDPRNLLLIQTLILSAGAVFVYLLSSEVLKNKNLSLTFAFIYLINPSLQRTNLYDFHAVALATTFFLAAFYFFIKKRYMYFLLFAFLAGICKEQLWIIVSLFGFLLFFQHKKYLEGSILFIISSSISIFLIMHAIPQALGSQHFAFEYYSDFGDGPLDIIKNIIFSPGQTLNTILQHDQIEYLKQIFSPLGYFSLLAPWYLIFAAPDLLINLLSNNPNLHQIYYQYTATITPFLFIAAIFGVNLLKKTTTKQFTNGTINVLIITFLLYASIHAAYKHGPLPGAKGANLDMITKQVADINFIDNELSKIPSSAKVAASNNIASHLSNRQYLYVTPLGIEKADYIVFYLTQSQPSDSLQKDLDLVQKYKLDPTYRVEVEKGIFIIFKKLYYVKAI